ncbi:alpha-tocopherol transfer protein-like isoform X4 [Stegodyphus dumicola]|uniref:alpha-tocopherol transfer protein-like isoform X4 n=1 Tax=Stegodyphus dumicola TaxID=202533 RepID=UPI0015A87DC8|nr:alpha-tocopherol transfer protein-like isoform X4 [Stegodyphus dumicola]
MDCKTLMQESQFMPLENTILNEIIIRKAEEELGETEQKRKVCLQELKIMIEEEKDLNADISEEFLLGFLRVRKFSVDAAFKLLKKYYLNRQIYPNVYRNFTPKHCHKILKANFLNFLPLRSPEGAAVWVPRLGIWDTDIFSPEEVTKFGLLCAEKEMRNPITQIYFHGDNLSSLHQFLPPQMLPEEFGGTQGSFENEQFYECLLANEEEFQQYQKFGYFSSKN